MTQVTIRQAGLVDFLKVKELVLEYLREFEDRPKDDAEREHVLLSVANALADGSMVFVLAENVKYKKAHPVGYGAFDLRPDIFGKLIGWGHHIYVRPGYRGMNIMQQILDEAEKTATGAGAEVFYVDTFIPKVFKEKFNYEDSYWVVKKQLLIQDKLVEGAGSNVEQRR